MTENAARICPAGDRGWSSSWLAAAINAPQAQEQIRTKTGRVTIGKLALFRIEQLQVPMPPLVMQQEYDRRCALIHQNRQRVARSLAEADTLFTALQTRAFRGEL